MQIEVWHLTGTPYEMGRQHGETLAEGARAMCDTRMALCLRAAPGASREALLKLAAESLPVFADFAPDTYEEFRGIADGAGLSESELYIGNGYTDFVDLVRRRYPPAHECTAFAVTQTAAADGLTYVGQTWDMHASAFPYVVALDRRPATGPASMTLTTTGCLSLIGLNEAGIAIGNNNLAPRDAGPGVMYLAMIHTALAQETFEDAVKAVTHAPRMSGHHYYLGGPQGQFAAIETTRQRHALLRPRPSGVYAHANHYNDEELAAHVGQTPGEASLRRESRMWEMLEEGAGCLGQGEALRLLADHEGPICCHPNEPEGGRTCAGVVMCPQQRAIWLSKGNPCEASPSRFEL